LAESNGVLPKESGATSGRPDSFAAPGIWLPESWLPDNWLRDNWLPDNCGNWLAGSGVMRAAAGVAGTDVTGVPGTRDRELTPLELTATGTLDGGRRPSVENGISASRSS